MIFRKTQSQMCRMIALPARSTDGANLRGRESIQNETTPVTFSSSLRRQSRLPMFLQAAMDKLGIKAEDLEESADSEDVEEDVVEEVEVE